MLHTITQRLEICIYINTEISEVDDYTWIFAYRDFRLALKIIAYQGSGVGVGVSNRSG